MELAWQSIRDNDPDIHSSLKSLSLLMYERGEVSVDADQFSSPFLEELIRIGLIAKFEGKLSFKSSELLGEYLTHHACERMSASWTDESSALEYYRKISRFQTLGSLHFDTQAFTFIERKVLLALRDKYSRDISEFVARASNLRNDSESGRVFRRLYRTYWEIAPEINIAAHDAIEIIDSLGKDYLNLSTYTKKEIE
ncbi:MAG: hypothetical protein AAFN93_28670 [Bacteroidota bacterium]